MKAITSNSYITMITDFLNVDIAKELELENLPEKDRQELVAKLDAVLSKRIGITLAGLLSEEDQEKLSEILDEEVEPFLRRHVPHMDLVIAEVVADLRKELIDFKSAAEAAAGK